ncbi:MAG: DUF948 domain-containing protein [Nitrospiraceae bacterium]|nr:MAG: DUF948 domain-containing protein [Nitrospiraceae bacterium]
MGSQFFWGIIAGAVIVLIAFLIPAILQITRTAKAAEDFIRSAEGSLNPLILKLNETVERTNRVAAGVEESVGHVQHLTKAIGETGALVEDVNRLFRHAGVFLSATSSGLGAGIRAAFGVLTKGAVEKITSSK